MARNTPSRLFTTPRKPLNNSLLPCTNNKGQRNAGLLLFCESSIIGAAGMFTHVNCQALHFDVGSQLSAEQSASFVIVCGRQVPPIAVCR